METKTEKKPKKSITVFLIFSTMLLTLALLGCGIYSLYISIGFRFLQRNTIGGINTTTLYSYPNSVYGTGGGTMFGLILISIVMLTLGVGVGIIFFKQLPLYKQISLVRKMPMIKYKDYSKQAKKRVIVYSIVAYVVCIAFSIFAVITASTSGISANYLWIVLTAYIVVLGLSVASLVLMIVKIVQLSKIKKKLLYQENQPQQKQEEEKQIEQEDDNKIEIVSMKEEQTQMQENLQEQKSDELFNNGIFELGEQLKKLREMLVVGLINTAEYEAIRTKWIDALLGSTLLGKKQTRRTVKIKQVS